MTFSFYQHGLETSKENQMHLTFPHRPSKIIVNESLDIFWKYSYFGVLKTLISFTSHDLNWTHPNLYSR